MTRSSGRELVLPLAVESPFGLLATVRLLQRTPGNLVHRWSDGVYSTLLVAAGEARVVSVRDEGSVERPCLALAIHGEPPGDEAAAGFVAAVRWSLGLDAPAAPLEALRAVEPALGEVVDAMRGMRAPCFADLWETCLATVPFQQLSLDAGTAIHGRFVERLGRTLSAGSATWYAVPDARTVLEAPGATLREVGFSEAKVGTLRALARIELEGGLDTGRFRGLATGEARRELLALPGIGPWSADVILLRGLRRMDRFPVGDTGSARSLAAVVGEPRLTPARAAELAARFGANRGYLYYLLLGRRLREKGLV